MAALPMSTDPQAGQMSRYDVATGELVSRNVGRQPHDVKFSGDGSLAYVADEDERRLLIADPESLEIIDEVDLPGKPHDLAVGPFGELWITLIERDVLAKVVGGSLELFSTGGSPHDLTVASDGASGSPTGTESRERDRLSPDPARFIEEARRGEFVSPAV